MGKGQKNINVITRENVERYVISGFTVYLSWRHLPVRSEQRRARTSSWRSRTTRSTTWACRRGCRGAASGRRWSPAGGWPTRRDPSRPARRPSPARTRPRSATGARTTRRSTTRAAGSPWTRATAGTGCPTGGAASRGTGPGLQKPTRQREKEKSWVYTRGTQIMWTKKRS